MAQEKVLLRVGGRDWGTAPTFLLLYPNTPAIGMSNLGYQFLLAHLLARRETFDRAFPGAGAGGALFPGPGAGRVAPVARPLAKRRPARSPRVAGAQPGRSLGGRPAASFPVHLVSLSFESDQLHLLRFLREAGIPLRARERRQGQPLIVAGGAAVAGNPVPVLAWADAVVVGDGEPVLRDVCDRLAASAGGRREALESLRGLPGVLLAGEDPPAGWRRALLESLDESPARTVVVSGEAVFADTVLIELTRGCGRGCRFCFTAWQCRPLRRLGLDAFTRILDEVGDWRGLSAGIVGASLADHPDLLACCRELLRRGIPFSTSSLRLEALADEVLDALAAGGSRTLTFAPEAGTERLRRAIGKPLAEERLRSALASLAARPDGEVKLYFMVGLPGETERDVQAIAELLAEARGLFRAAGRAGALKVGVSPFVPKPQTPFQWAPFAPLRLLEERLARLRREAARLGLRLSAESPRAAQVEALLARADAAVMEQVIAYVEDEPARGGPGEFRRRLGGRGGALAALEREIAAGAPLPWDGLDPPVARERLRRLYEAALGPEGEGTAA